MPKLYKKIIFDNIHGNIALTRVEDRILGSAYYQRLKWIKQLGFTFYLYSGATHTRFSHALGVMHIMNKLLLSIGHGVSEEKLHDPNYNDPKKDFHQMMRLAAMLHDIGTFPFSHTIELAYINHWKLQSQNGKKTTQANHEVLGSQIIQNTDFEGGLTKILKEEGIDPHALSEVIAGRSPIPLANQLLHSDVDADRMDYLLRDSHHTGINYGQYDLDFLIRNATTSEVEGNAVLCIKEEAIHVVEYFLISRFYWYSQIIEDGTGYKFDLLAAKIYQYFLENGNAHSFEDLLQKVSQNPNQYFTFNDGYFLTKMHEYLESSSKHKVIHNLCEMLAYRHAPKQLKVAPFDSSIVKDNEHRAFLVKQAKDAADWLELELKNLDPNAWIIFDLPKRDVIFTKDSDSLVKDLKGKNPLLARDPVKILTRQGELKLLVNVNNSLFQVLSQYRNFIPRLYLSSDSYDLLKKKKVFEEMKVKFGLKAS